MAACEILQHIFKKSLPENPTLLGSISQWNQIKSPKPIEDSSFTEIFGELHFKEKNKSPLRLSSSSSSSSLWYQSPQPTFETIDTHTSPNYFSTNQYVGFHRNSDSFSSMNSESLQLCTEGLGFESSDEVEELSAEMGSDWQNKTTVTRHTRHTTKEIKRSRSSGKTFPPPISSIGKSGKPLVCFKSYRHDGRFVLKEVRMPTQEFLRAIREDGRLKLQLCMSDDEIFEDEEEDEETDFDDDLIRGKEGENDGGKNVKVNNNRGGGS